MTPHPQRCETCQNTDCDLHEQGKHNKNPDTGYEWDHYHWYHAIINEKGCASHSSAPVPAGYLITEEQMSNIEQWYNTSLMITSTFNSCRKHPVLSEQSIRQDERDQILKQSHKWFENYCEGNEDPDLWMAYLHAERAFRKEQL